MLLLVLSLIMLHPFHVSVTEVTYQEKDRALQVTQRIFFDDLEKGIQKAYNQANYHLTIPLDTFAIQYVTSQSIVIVKDRQARLLGAEEDKELVWVYFEMENVAPNTEIIFWSKLLTYTFEDQENLVHFKFPHGKETYRLNIDKEEVHIRIK